jgi:hypothetical protein
MRCTFCNQPATTVIRTGETKAIYTCAHCFDIAWEILTYSRSASNTE